ncbi:MAG: hypothetical protein WDN31_21590 [Hyphomicrobium sp.]
MLGIICVFVAAAPLAGGAIAAEIKVGDIAGRWQGSTWAEDNSGPLTLDIAKCGDGWCGIRVAANDTCAGTALKVNAGVIDEDGARFEGTLQLAPGTEAYVVRASIFPPEDGKPLEMQLTGDTGGEYRAYRRSFPYEAELVRLKDAVCHVPSTVSSLR